MKIYHLGCAHRLRKRSVINISMIGIRIAIVYRIGFERALWVVNLTASYNIAVDKFRMSQ